MEKFNANVCTWDRHSTPSERPGNVKVEFRDNNLTNFLGDNASCSEAVKVKEVIHYDSEDDGLDHILLKERQRMLQLRKLLGKAESVPGGISEVLYHTDMEGLLQQSAGKVKGESFPVNGEFSMAGSSCGTHQKSSSSCGDCQGSETNKADICNSFQESSSKNTSDDNKTCSVHANPDTFHSSTLSSFGNVKLEPLESNDLHIKIEPLESNEFHSQDGNFSGSFYFSNVQKMKNEVITPDEFHQDDLDHMPLRDRIKLLTSGKVSDLTISRNYENTHDVVPSALDCSPIVLESIKPISIKRLRKRKKTVTDSVETALEEDAPGLLQVLINNGVSMDEIRLYGETEDDDALKDSFSDDSFGELEAVMSKIFSQHQSLLKFAPIRCSKGSRSSYCLACLISLVEQTRYLHFRKWPVQWGWCRDLQSFIFVFERHNRIVLERPEYGYATYFFELVDSLPIDWQIKRLVIAMKLTSCSRINLIENKALLVGDDLTEGEAKVLMEYGWIPNTGLGTMLNYCDRVVHDKKNEKDVSEWRSKIGKLLMDGYNGGTIVLTDMPRKVMGYRGTLSQQIKFEL